jgi:hypothetical protein
MAKLVPIKCEIRFAATTKEIFHIVELKTGKEKLVSYGRVFPIKGLKRFIPLFEKEYGTKVVNRAEFIRAVKEDVRVRREQQK